MTIETRKINGLLIHLDSLQPFTISIEAGKQVSTFQGSTKEALISDLKTLQVCDSTLSKVIKTALFLIESAADS